MMATSALSRRRFLASAGYCGLSAAFARITPAWAVESEEGPGRLTQDAGPIDITIAPFSFDVNGRLGSAIAMNGSVPGPIIRLREGKDAVIRVTNRLNESTSIHWHGIILPPEMDGVPGVSFAGIRPGETFTYRFPVRQSGTYWCHSHSGAQELLGVYAPLVVEPATPEPFHYDRDYVVVLSDYSFESPMTIIRKLKGMASYYNYQKQTAVDFLRDARRGGLRSTLNGRLMWSEMNMDPTDMADVTGATYTYLMNGHAHDANWTGLFRPGEKVRLRFIDSGAMTLFDVRIPGLTMTVVQADGQNVQPVEVDEFRIAPGETYDVLVEPEDERAYTVFAEAMDRSGFARGTLAVHRGLAAPIPERRTRAVRTMADMGMGPMGGHAGHGASQGAHEEGSGEARPERAASVATAGGTKSDALAPHTGHGASDGGQEHGASQASSSHSSSMEGMSDEAMAAMDSPAAADHKNHGASKSEVRSMEGMDMPATAAGGRGVAAAPVKHGPDHHGPGNAAVAEFSQSRLGEPGLGLGDSGRRVLVYTDLKSLMPGPDHRQPTREIELHVTGNMERYMWSFDGKKYSEAKTPIRFHYGERVRLTLVNDTMMEHPLHLHGMWMELENGAGHQKPRKHTVIIKPAERWSVAITADALGSWAFHCHLLLHMEMGMFRVVEVVKDEGAGRA